MCLLAICIFLEKCLVLCPFFFIGLLLSCKSSLCILDIKPVSHTWFADIFSCSVGCLFILLTVSFERQSCTTEVQFIFFFFSGACASDVMAKNPLLSPMSERFIPRFSFKSFMVFSLILIVDPFWVEFCIWCEVSFQFHSFSCGDPAVPEPFVEETVLSPLNGLWHLCQKSVGHWHIGLFLASQFDSIGLYVYPYATTTMFWLSQHCIKFWYWEAWAF